jgi:Fic family protein
VVYRTLDEAVEELRARMGGLPAPDEAEDVWRSIWFEEAHNSTAIEGNTLVLRQVEALLADGRVVGRKHIAEYLEVRGYAEAATWVYRQALGAGEWSGGKLITLTEVRRVHQMAMAPAWDASPHPEATTAEGPGGFRRHDIRPLARGMRPPPWSEVDASMRDWVEHACRVERGGGHLVERVAALHGAFERIHPFLDGNGRAGRLTLNLLLVRLGYPPAVISNRRREAYLAALRRSDAGDTGSLGELVARSVLENLYRFVIPAVAGPKRLVPLASLADPELSHGALRVAVHRGRLKAVQGSDGQWRSTRAWVNEYRKDRYRRRG